MSAAQAHERFWHPLGVGQAYMAMLVLFAVFALPTPAQSQTTRSLNDDVGFTVRAVDALFGHSVAGTVAVTSAEGQVRSYDLENGRALVRLSRSDRDYRVDFDGSGTARSQTFRPTGRSIVLRVVTPLDIGVLTLLHVSAAIAFFFARRSGGTEAKSRRSGTVLPRPFRPKPSPEAPVLVRVRLTSGRVVEGWMDPASQEQNSEEVLGLTPIRAFDANGNADVPNPLDSFIPRSTLSYIETLDETHSDPAGDLSDEGDQSVVDRADRKSAGG